MNKCYYRLILRGGRVYEGRTKGEIIEKMRSSWFGEDLTKIQYKDEVSRRVYMLYGRVLNRSRFLKDLVSEGLATLEIIEMN